MVQRILDGMSTQGNMLLFMAMNHIFKNIVSDWIGAVSYMYNKVTMLLTPKSGRNQKRNDSYNGRQVSGVNSGQCGCGGHGIRGPGRQSVRCGQGGYVNGTYGLIHKDGKSR